MGEFRVGIGTMFCQIKLYNITKILIISHVYFLWYSKVFDLFIGI